MTSAVPFRDATASEVEAAPGSREQKAARYIAARRFGGIPTKGFLLGDNDHSPMMKGVVDLTTEVYKLTDMIGEAGDLPESNWSAIVEQRAKVVAMLEDHGCPAAGDAGNGDEEVRRDGD